MINQKHKRNTIEKKLNGKIVGNQPCVTCLYIDLARTKINPFYNSLFDIN